MQAVDALDSIITPAPANLIKGNFTFQSVYQTKAGLCCLVFLTTMLISISLEPPFLLVKPRDPFQEQKICYSRSLFLSAASALLFLKLPGWCREK
jgi:hypothetical protein